jgi:hypothetical protein
MSTPNGDAWELVGFPGRLDIAAYLTADQLEVQYRVLVDVLLDAQEHSLTGVGRDELLTAVRDRIAGAAHAATAERLTRPEAFDLDARMRALQDWKVVIRWQDKAKTEADFIRTWGRYQLTSEAADLHRWLRRKIDEDAVSTSAAAFAPAIIAERLDDTIRAIRQRDLSRAAQAWAQVRTTLKDMAEAASIWQSRMASALAGAPDADKMARLRETLMAYVTVWELALTPTARASGTPSANCGRPSPTTTGAMALSGVDAAAAEDTVQAGARLRRFRPPRASGRAGVPGPERHRRAGKRPGRASDDQPPELARLRSAAPVRTGRSEPLGFHGERQQRAPLEAGTTRRSQRAGQLARRRPRGLPGQREAHRRLDGQRTTTTS